MTDYKQDCSSDNTTYRIFRVLAVFVIIVLSFGYPTGIIVFAANKNNWFRAVHTHAADNATPWKINSKKKLLRTSRDFMAGLSAAVYVPEALLVEQIKDDFGVEESVAASVIRSFGPEDWKTWAESKYQRSFVW